MGKHKRASSDVPKPSPTLDDLAEMMANPEQAIREGRLTVLGMPSSPRPANVRLPPMPERGMPFDQALDETMRDHHAVFAALAK